MAAIETDDDGAGIDGLNPADHVAHGDAVGREVVGVGVMRQQVAFLALADESDATMPGEEDEGDVGTVGGLRQPVRQGADEGIPAGLSVGEYFDLFAGKAADFGIKEQTANRAGVAGGRQGRQAGVL